MFPVISQLWHRPVKLYRLAFSNFSVLISHNAINMVFKMIQKHDMPLMFKKVNQYVCPNQIQDCISYNQVISRTRSYSKDERNVQCLFQHSKVLRRRTQYQSPNIILNDFFTSRLLEAHLTTRTQTRDQ